MADLDAIARMNIELRADEQIDNFMTDDQVKDRMREFLSGQAYKVHVFEVNDRIIGYSVVDVTKTPPYMRQFFIARDSRRSGHGRAFFRLLARALGADSIDVEVLVWNKGALEFYKHLGFVPRYVGLRARNRDR